jgi:hypothetical protein
MHRNTYIIYNVLERCMTIIISKNGKNAKKVDKSRIEEEDYLQKYIYDNPDSIPLYDIKENIRLSILSREFPTDSGPIDAIGIDKDGEIYLVETKLYKNPDKRLVVAQVLDYGASLWKNVSFEDFIATLEEKSSKTFGMTLDQKLSETFEILDDEVLEIREKLRDNFNRGNFKFVVLMDELHDELKDLIVFINQNSKFDIFAVQMEYYKFEDYEIIIPRLYGAEVKKDASSRPEKRGKWDEQKFFAHARENLTEEQCKAIEVLHNFSKAKMEIRWGTGSKYGSFNPIYSKIGRSLYTVYSDGTLALNFWLRKHPLLKQRYKQLLLENRLFGFSPDFDGEHYNVPIEKWLDHLEQFQNIITELLDG